MSTPAYSSASPDGTPRRDGRSITPEPPLPKDSGFETPSPAVRHHSGEPDHHRFSSSSKHTPTNATRTYATEDSANASDAKDHQAPVRASQDPVQVPANASPTAVDPLSQHILMRTNAESFSPRLRYPVRLESAGPDTLQRLSSDLSAKKAPSFLSRLNIRNRKKEDESDDVSEIGGPRLSGSDARVFSSAVGAGGYIPHHKEPPRYIKVRAHNSKRREFNRMFLAQQLRTGDDQRPPAEATGDSADGTVGAAIWALEFSKDGKYLAAAGKDRVVRVWAVLSSPEDRIQHEEEETENKATAERLSAPVFRGNPFREYSGHTGDVLDLGWSKNNFLLSSSMDKTVRLWHVSRQECLCTFTHQDFVTSIAFHPTDDRFFLAGSLDAQLRLWSIPDKSTAYAAQLPDLVTAVAFSPDGKTAIAGVLSGACLFFDTEGLKLLSQMLVRSSRGKNAKGSKITGITTMAMPPGSSEAEVKVLITSNDSRVRMYNLKDKAIDVKLKGHENVSSQIHASFSDDARYVICGSEDKKTFIWPVSLDGPEAREKVPYEYFDAHSARVSAAVFAPSKSRQLLSASGDPLYDLCNPPPVKLVSLGESLAASQMGLSDDTQPSPGVKEGPKESPAYVEKSKHPGGNIVVTADQSGSIKVFRQDCAHVKRRHDNWETSSNFSRKLMGQGALPLLGRNGSVRTRTTAGSQSRSRRTSLSQPAMTSDRINSWRHGIDSGRNSGRNSTRNSLISAVSVHSERSTSSDRMPRPRASRTAIASEARKHDAQSSLPHSQASRPGSPTAITASSPRSTKVRDQDNTQPNPPTPSFSFRPADDDDQLRVDPAGASYPFWNLNRWRNVSSLRNTTPGNPNLLTPLAVSKSSADQLGKDRVARRRASAGPGTFTHTTPSNNQQAGTHSRNECHDEPQVEGREGEAETLSLQGDAPDAQERISPLHTIVSRLGSETTINNGDEVRTCEKCSGREFKTKRMVGKQRLLCSKCGMVAE